jgi:hypothetical protein
MNTKDIRDTLNVVSKKLVENGSDISKRVALIKDDFLEEITGILENLKKLPKEIILILAACLLISTSCAPDNNNNHNTEQGDG